jgi:AraC-like DNA-binding protein
MPRISFPSQSNIKDIAFYDRRDGKSSLRMPPHLHSEVELICLFQGELVIRVDGVPHTMRNGDAMLVFPRQVHFPESDEGSSFCVFDFSPYFFPELERTLFSSVPSNPIVRGAMYLPRMRNLFDELVQFCSDPEPDSSPAASAVRRGYLLTLVSTLIAEMPLTKPSRVDTGSMRAIVSFCMDNFSENLSLDLLSEKLGLNKFYISHLFGEKMGISFNDYVNYLRIRAACSFLRHTAHSIGEIAAEVGFNSARTFNRAFIKFFGMTPSEYRNIKAKEGEL